MSTAKYTFCRICEPACPLIADVDDHGEISRLRPDREHPVSRGFACPKGLSYLDVHNDPDRVNHPLRRTNPRAEGVGKFERVSWEDAFADIGRRLRSIRGRHGVDALATYYGNPVAFNSKAVVPVASLPIKIGTRSGFGAATGSTNDACTYSQRKPSARTSSAKVGDTAQ